MIAPRRTFDWIRAVSAWGPVVLYMTAIFFASAEPTMPLERWTSLSDKEIHAVVYLGLTLLAYRAAMVIPLKRAFDPIAQALTISALYGIFDELHQLFVPGRHTELRDWLADVTGTLIAVSAIVLIRTFAGNGGTRSVQEKERQ